MITSGGATNEFLPLWQKAVPHLIMQSRPTFSPFEVEEKLLRDSPLEETLQYGEYQQTRVHIKVSNMLNLDEPTLHRHI